MCGSGGGKVVPCSLGRDCLGTDPVFVSFSRIPFLLVNTDSVFVSVNTDSVFASVSADPVFVSVSADPLFFLSSVQFVPDITPIFVSYIFQKPLE